MKQYHIDISLFFIDVNNTSKGIKLYITHDNECNKYSIFALGVRDNVILKELSLLNVGESYSIYKRVQ